MLIWPSLFRQRLLLLIILISGDHSELPSNELFMAVCEHHLSRKLLLSHAFVLACVVRCRTGRGGEGSGREMAV